jgi:uncharacterized protein (TIGR01777 family)
VRGRGAVKVFMTGGTGFVGSSLTQKLTELGHEVTILTRSKEKAGSPPTGVTFLEGDPTEKGAWQERLADHEVIINLAGTSIFTRWNKDTKRLIRDSRVLTTQNVVEGLSARSGMETVLLSTSAVGYYGFRGEEELDESSAPGGDFLASLSQEWESAAFEARQSGARVVICRLGIVLGKGGGALNQMIPIFKKGLGSPLGNGKQWFSWIHQEDLAACYLYLLERKEFSGPVNCTAPNPVRNQEFTKALGEALGKPTFMPAVPGFMIKMIMGEFGSVLLNGQKVLPNRLLSMGFQFSYPDIRKALNALLQGS